MQTDPRVPLARRTCCRGVCSTPSLRESADTVSTPIRLKPCARRIAENFLEKRSPTIITKARSRHASFNRSAGIQSGSCRFWTGHIIMVRRNNIWAGSRRVILRAVATIFFTAGQAIAWRPCGYRSAEIFHRYLKFRPGIGRAKSQRSEVRGQRSEKVGNRAFF